MRKNIFLQLITILTIFGCTQKEKLNDPVSVSKFIINSLKTNDSNSIKLVLSNPIIDSIIIDSINRNMSLIELNNSSNIKSYEEIYNRNKENISNHFLKGGELNDRITENLEFIKNNKIDLNNIELLRVELHNELLSYNRKTFFVYFKTKDSIPFVLLLVDPYFKNDTLKVSNFDILTEEYCNNYFYIKLDFENKEDGYVYLSPEVVLLRGGTQWRYNQYNQNEFTNFYIKLRNKSDYDFNKVKIHISFTNPRNPEEIFFSKSITKEVDLKKGEIILVDLNEICNTNIGFNVSSNNNFQVHTYIEDIFPFPYSKEFTTK